jgi:hypothetical protein
MSSLYLLLLCTIGALIIHLWLNSDFFAYYIKSLRFLIPKSIYNWLLIEDYFKHNDPNLNVNSYIDFLLIKRYFDPSFKIKFFLKLFSCSICFSVWVALVLSLIYGNILYVGLIYAILRVLDFILRYTLYKQI